MSFRIVSTKKQNVKNRFIILNVSRRIIGASWNWKWNTSHIREKCASWLGNSDWSTLVTVRLCHLIYCKVCVRVCILFQVYMYCVGAPWQCVGLNWILIITLVYIYYWNLNINNWIQITENSHSESVHAKTCWAAKPNHTCKSASYQTALNWWLMAWN